MYDYAFLGGGLASLQLAKKISDKQSVSIIIIEKDANKKNDRTWCFWSREKMEYDEIVSKRWNKCRFISRSGKISEKKMAPYDYRQVRSEIFYETVLNNLTQKPEVKIIYSEVHNVHEAGDRIDIHTNSGTIQAKIVFDSRINFRNYTSPQINAYKYATQHFYGEFIKLDKDYFNPEAFTMMDFSYPCLKDEFGFVYILPYTERHALVELTFFSNKIREEEEYRQLLHRYIRNQICSQYEILETEKGKIPMLDRKIRRHSGGRMIKIGTNGGLTKVSTGYTFARVLADSEKLANYLAVHSRFHKYKPFVKIPLHDRIVLDVILKEPLEAMDLFEKLFQELSSEQFFRFLDDKMKLWELIGVYVKAPIPKFTRYALSSLFRKNA